MKIPASAKYAIIEQMMQREDNMLNIKWLCETAGVSRSGYYHYLQTADLREQREQKDRQSTQNRCCSRQPAESRVRGARPESHIADRHNIYHQWQGTALLYVNNNRCLHKGTAGLGIK